MFVPAVEKYRDNNGKGRGRQTNRLAKMDALPAREKMSLGSFRRVYTANTMQVRRWLAGQVGRPWNAVYSELCDMTPPNSLERVHADKAVENNVDLVVTEENGVLYSKNGWSLTSLRGGDLYVRNDVLCRVPVRKVVKPTPALRVTFTDQTTAVGISNGQWFAVELTEYTPKMGEYGDQGRYDVFLKDTVGKYDAVSAYGKAMYATAKRAMSKKEIKAFKAGH